MSSPYGPSEIPVYGPSETMTWLTCPILRRLEYVEGWRVRTAGARELGAAAGTIMHRWLAQYYGGTLPDVSCQLNELTALRPATERDQATLASLPTRLTNAWAFYLAHDPLPTAWRRIGPEITLTEDRCRLDLVVDKGVDRFSVVDFKTRTRLDPQYLSSVINEYRTSWQLHHYVWAWTRYTGVPTWEYDVVLIVFEPRPAIHLLPYTVHSETMAMWEASARRVWAQMAAEDDGRAEPWMAGVHETRFGLCPMWRACFEYRLHPELMAASYIKEPRHATSLEPEPHDP